MNILDQFGRPIRPSGNRLNTPAWVVRETVNQIAGQVAAQRVRELRQSVADDQVHAGETIRVRTPRRYEAGA